MSVKILREFKEGRFEMLNFTVGPVQMGEKVRSIGANQVPYFRTPEFSNIMLENERLIKKFAKADDNDRVVFITGSGTASMEAVIMNTLKASDKAIVVNGGSFGHRFVELCDLHEIDYSEIKLETGKALKRDHLLPFEGKGYTVFIVNIHETSTGVHYDLDLISDFCKRNNIFLIVDAISSFIADEINFKSKGIDAMIIGSQKALACPPGISVIVLSKRAIERVSTNKCKCMYLDLQNALKNGERGQTPFTPAVGILLQINARLKEIKKNGGVEEETNRIRAIASDFREKIKGMPFEIVSESMSNAVTPLHPLKCSAYDIFTMLKDKYGIWVCPNGGDLADKVFRVGHIGDLGIDDNSKLISALEELHERGLI